MAVTIIDNPDHSRFEAHVGDKLAGYLEYDKHDNYTAFLHTEVNKSHRGLGVASELVRTAMDEVRNEDDRAYAVCPYVQQWLSKHPEYEDLSYTPSDS